MILPNRFSLHARTDAAGDRSVAFVLVLLLALVFAPVVLLHLAVTASATMSAATTATTALDNHGIAPVLAPKRPSRG